MGDLVRVATRIGYYVNAVWVTEGVRPGVIACSQSIGIVNEIKPVADVIGEMVQEAAEIHSRLADS